MKCQNCNKSIHRMGTIYHWRDKDIYICTKCYKKLKTKTSRKAIGAQELYAVVSVAKIKELRSLSL